MSKKRGYYDVFVKTCAKFPSRVAVREYTGAGYRVFSYSELYGACEYIAQNLQQLPCSRGCVGLVTTRNALVPCLIAATHKCCKTFMFIDPSGQDIEGIVSSLKLPVVISITSEDDEDRCDDDQKADRHISVFGYSINFFQYNHNYSNNYFSTRSCQDYAFIALTSGSTGEPKKVQVPMQCIQPNIDDFTKLFNITPQDVIYFSTPLTFDPSMIEIMLACENGASLLIAPEKIDVLFPNNGEHSITVWQTTPSKFFQHSNASIKNKILGAKSTLKILALGGEPLSGVKRLRELKHEDNKTKLFVLYGVTEMSCWACAAELDLARCRCDWEVPLGQCLSETQVQVRPDSASSNSHTSTGTIILVSKSRKCVVLSKSSRSGSEEINSLKFVDTGDQGEIRNGTIYYRGRKDDVVKRFGHKINLQFIEQTIMLCPRVKSCSCVWLPKPHLLVVYFASETLSSQALSDFLKCKLDDKHWPDHIVRVANLPTNFHGKISRLILSRLFETRKPVAKLLTLESMTATFVDQLNSVLNSRFCYKDIRDKNFLSIGGTSFLAVTLCNKLNAIHQQFGRVLLPSLLTRKHTLSEILHMAEKEICTNVVTRKRERRRIKRSTSDLDPAADSVESTILSSYRKSSPRTAPSEPIEFVTMWSYDTGKCVDASPTLFQTGTYLYVVVGSHSGRIVVFDAIAGVMVGVVKLDSRVEASVYCYHQSFGEDPCGVVGAHDGTVVAFSLETAKEKWRANVGSMVKSKAAGCNGLLFVATYDGLIQYLDIMTGQIKKTVQVTEQAISADLALAKREYILMGALSGVCASLHAETSTVAWRASVASPVFAAPVLYDQDKYVIFAEVNGEIHCRTVEKGIKIWKYQGAKGNIFSSMFVKEIGKMKWQVVFGCHDKKVYSITIKNYQPTLQWKTTLDSPVYSTPCGLKNMLLLAASKNGTLYVLEAENGIILGEHKLPNETFSTPAVYGDYIYIGCRNDLLYGLRYILNF